MRSFWILFSCVVISSGQETWTLRARVKHHTDFFMQVMQETIYEMERRGFSSMTLLDITQNINLQMYRWQVNGTVHYTNGFLVSIQKIDVTAMTQSVSIPIVDGVSTPRATVSGTLNFRDIKLGYDVNFLPFIGREKRFTGDFTHSLINLVTTIAKNLTTKEVTVSMTIDTSGGLVRMVYRPASNVTEVLSREFFPFNNGPGVSAWSTVIEPIILDVIRNKVPFPEVCFSHC